MPQHPLQPVLPRRGDVDGQRRAAVHYRHRSSGKEVLREVDDDLGATGKTGGKGRGENAVAGDNRPIRNAFLFHSRHRESPRNRGGETRSQSLLPLPVLSLWEPRTFAVTDGKGTPPLPCSRTVPWPKRREGTRRSPSPLTAAQRLISGLRTRGNLSVGSFHAITHIPPQGVQRW